MRKVTIVVAAFTTTCQMSDQSKAGPLASQVTIADIAATKAAGWLRQVGDMRGEGRNSVLARHLVRSGGPVSRVVIPSPTIRSASRRGSVELLIQRRAVVLQSDSEIEGEWP